MKYLDFRFKEDDLSEPIAGSLYWYCKSLLKQCGLEYYEFYGPLLDDQQIGLHNGLARTKDLIDDDIINILFRSR